MCYFCYLLHQQCVCFTYSYNIKGVVTHFSDLSILVMHQIYQIGWSLWRWEVREKAETTEILKKDFTVCLTSP